MPNRWASMGIVEPVFGNIKNNRRMNRFTLRGIPKVTVQWLYYCLVHNIGAGLRWIRVGALWITD